MIHTAITTCGNIFQEEISLNSSQLRAFDRNSACFRSQINPNLIAQKTQYNLIHCLIIETERAPRVTSTPRYEPLEIASASVDGGVGVSAEFSATQTFRGK